MTLHLVLYHFTLLCFLLLSSLHRPIPRFSPPFPFLFLFLLPSERPPIGFGGGRRLCGIIMGSSWENCPWKGLSEKKGEKKKKNLVLFPILLGNIHQGTPAVWRGAVPSHPCSPLSGWVTLPLPRLSKPRSMGWCTCFRKMFFICPALSRLAVMIGEHLTEPEHLMLYRCFEISSKMLYSKSICFVTLLELLAFLLVKLLHENILNLSSYLGCYWARLSVSTGKPNK